MPAATRVTLAAPEDILTITRRLMELGSMSKGTARGMPPATLQTTLDR